MFKKNLDALKLKNKNLAEKLIAIDLETIKEDFEVYEAESKDVIISYQGLALDDIYDPIRVAKTNWNLNVTKTPSKYDIVVVFGLGLGYLFKRAYINCDSRILLFEPEINILRYVLEYVDFSEIISEDRVFITNEKKEALSFLTEKYLSDDNLFFLFPEAYAQLSTQIMSDFTNDIVEICNLKKMDVNTIKKMAKKWTMHTLNNLTRIQNSRPLSWLKDRYKGKTALIAAAGPSLADNIEQIKKNRDKFIIFSVNRAAPTLYKNGIKPDFVLFADVNSVNDNIKDIVEELKTTNIIADLRANSQVYSTFENILTYFSKNDLIAQNINNVSGNSFSLLETAGTATAQSYYAARLLGMTDIIFVGLDLVFKDNVIYADGKTVSSINDGKISIDNSKNYIKSLVTVKDLNGNEVKTRDDYALFIRQFEEIFEADSVANVYNVSDFAAFIKGMQYTSFDKIITSANNVEINIYNDILNFKAETAIKWNNIYQNILELLQNEKENLKEISEKTFILLKREKDVITKLINNSADSDSNVKLADMTSEFTQLLPEIIKDAFLSQYFQSEFLSFVNMKNESIEKGNETFIKLKNFEIQLLESVVSISADWIKFLEEKFN